MGTLGLRCGFSLVLLVAPSACGLNKPYLISSDPPGAVVSSGKVVYGTTPFTTDLNTVLPNRGWDGKFSASRQLTFTKDGYLPGTAVISEFGGKRSIHVVLQEQVEVDRTPSNERSAESRLLEIQRLRDRGLISQEEYEAKRREILSGI